MVIKISFKTLKVNFAFLALICAYQSYAADTVINVPTAVQVTANGDNDTIRITGNGSVTTNPPTIAVTLNGNNTRLTVEAPTGGGGLISETAGEAAAVQIGGNNVTINNAGTIQNFGVNASTINAINAGTNAATIHNAGYILSTDNTGNAINFQNVTLGVARINQNAGMIRGNIILPNAANANAIIDLNAGFINGGIFSLNALPATAHNHFNVGTTFNTGGHLGRTPNNVNTGLSSISINNNRTVFTVNHILVSNQLNINVNATMDVQANGSWIGFNPIASITNNGTLNFRNNSSFDSGNASIVTNNNVLNLSDNAQGTLGNNSTLNNTGRIKIEGAATLAANGSNLNNAGTLDLHGTNAGFIITANNLNNNNQGNIITSSNQNISSIFTQNGGGRYTTNLHSALNFGRLNFNNNATLVANSFITANVLDNGTFIDNGQTFDILTTPVAFALVDNSNLDVQGSPLVNFTKATVVAGGNRVIRLTAHRVPYANFINPSAEPQLGGLANTLDAIRNSPMARNESFLKLFTNLDAVLVKKGANVFQEALLQFLPDVSGALRMISVWQLENMDFKTIDNRLERIASLERSRDYIPVRGYVAGDSILGQECTGPIAFGTIGQQKVPMINFPYDFNTGGVGIFKDYGVTDCLYMGFSGTYSYTTVFYKNNTGSKTTFSTTQGAVYGSYNRGWTFVDGIFSYGFNVYQSKRVQPLIAQTSLGSFKGNQGSGRIRAGFAVPIRYINVIPMTSFQYTQIHIGGYTENGGAALKIPSQAFTSAIWGLGLRLALHNLDTDVKTEVHGMYYQDMKASQIAVTSQLLEGGPAFVTTGNNPKKNHYNAGASASVMIIPNMTLCVAYDFLQQEGLKSSNYFIRLRWIN